jgi:hypothetical protein
MLPPSTPKLSRTDKPVYHRTPILWMRAQP